MSTGNITTKLETKTITIDSDLSSKQYHFVAFDATDENVVNIQADAAKMPFVLLDDGDGSTAAIRGSIALDGVTQIKLAGTVAAGAALTATTGGEAVATTTDGDLCGGIALKGGVDGDLIEMKISQFVYSA